MEWLEFAPSTGYLLGGLAGLAGIGFLYFMGKNLE